MFRRFKYTGRWLRVSTNGEPTRFADANDLQIGDHRNLDGWFSPHPQDTRRVVTRVVASAGRPNHRSNRDRAASAAEPVESEETVDHQSRGGAEND
jgi:hypothetical protein